LLLITNIKWSKNSTVFRGTRFHPLVLCNSSCTILWFLNSPSLFVFLYFLFFPFLDFLCLDKHYFQIHGNLSNPIMSCRVPFHLNCNHLWKACWRFRIKLKFNIYLNILLCCYYKLYVYVVTITVCVMLSMCKYV
jgi:hypothetical protein